jgi:hypothetical protein
MTIFAKFSALLVVALLNSLGAQDQSTPTRFRANAEIVVVPVRVTDHREKPINGLRAENFTVFDEQVPQPIVSLTGEDSPCSVVLVLDVSDSMRKTLSAFKDAVSVSAFLAESNPEDEFLLLNVSTSPAMISGFTTVGSCRWRHCPDRYHSPGVEANALGSPVQEGSADPF